MRQSGFTLLELSIVLVIIGLIIGGVTVGAELIKQAELQAVGKDFQRYETAVQTFRLKYKFPPGDLPNAYGYFPSIGSNQQVCAAFLAANGNGDGFIQQATWINNGENARSWLELNLSGILPGSYTGHYSGHNGNPGYGIYPGITVPKGAVSGSGVELQSTYSYGFAGCAVDTVAAEAGPLYGRHGNYLTLARPGDRSNDEENMLIKGAITPGEAQSIDAKMDDGKHNSGKIVSRNPWSSTGCDNGSGAYDVAQQSALCRLVYWLN